MPQINYEDYESLTVAELKEMADSQGIEIPSDARKSDIIDALAAAAKKEETKSTEAESPEAKTESGNTYEFQMNSTTTALIDSDEYWKIKLHS